MFFPGVYEIEIVQEWSITVLSLYLHMYLSLDPSPSLMNARIHAVGSPHEYLNKKPLGRHIMILVVNFICVIESKRDLKFI